MGQFTHEGVVYEEMPDGSVKVVGYAQQQPANPQPFMTSPGDPAKPLEVERLRQQIGSTAATAP
jgi:hypothetical protein